MTALILFLFFLAALFVIAWIIVETGKRNAESAKEYDAKYLRIESIIDNYQVCEANYDWIMSLLKHLGQLPYKDKERTSVLTTKFFRAMKMITMISILMMITTVLTAPPYKTGYIARPEAIAPYEALWNATCYVESGFDVNVIGDKHLKNKSYGIAQIRKSRLDDYFHQTGIRYTTKDMFCPVKSKEVFMWYASQYNPWETREISSAWNAGPEWRKKKSVKNYYQKIQKQL